MARLHAFFSARDLEASPLGAQMRLLMDTFAVGEHRPFAIEALSGDAVFTFLAGGVCPSLDTIYRDLARFDDRALVELDELMAAHGATAVRGCRGKVVHLDVDTTVTPVFGEHEGALPGPNPRYHGRPSYHPILARVAETDTFLGAELRPGDRGFGEQDAPTIARFIDRCRAAIGQNKVMYELLAGRSGELARQIERWRKSPFSPHAIARLRPLAYQKAVVMKYIDNLIRWADQLFRRDNRESINEATQLYLLAAGILGPRPQGIPPRATVAAKTYRELEPLLDDFSNALVQVENLVTPAAGSADEDVEALVMPTMLYFCVPPNDKLVGYWDTVADRLFKIRHCMNIEGVVRQLPLFESPLDPALLVRAAAAGVSLSGVITDLGAPAPHHRFAVLVQKANELCAEVKALGQALLAAPHLHHDHA